MSRHATGAAPMTAELESATAIVVREIARLGKGLTSIRCNDAEGTVEIACRDGFGNYLFAIVLSDGGGAVRTGIVRKHDHGACTLVGAWPCNAEGPVPGRCFTLDAPSGMRLFLRALWRELAFHLDVLPPPETMIALSIEEIVARDPKDGGFLVARLIAQHAPKGQMALAHALFAAADPDPIPTSPRAAA